jgi:hypothetical protein
MIVAMVSWLLALLAVQALVSTGEARFERESTFQLMKVQQARLHALAGMEIAIGVLEECQDNSWDSPTEGWSWNPSLRAIDLGEGFCSVGYERQGISIYGVEDEESRIPLQRANQEILERLGFDVASQQILMEFCAIDSALAQQVDVTRIGGLDSLALKRATEVLTLQTSGAVNINTAPEIVLSALGIPPTAVRKILRRRRGVDGEIGTPDDRPLRSVRSLSEGLGACDLTSKELSMVRALSENGLLSVTSNYYTIRSRGWSAGTGAYYQINVTVRLARNERGVESDFVVWSEGWMMQ